MESFLATVKKVFISQEDFLKYEKQSGNIADYTKVYNTNKNFTDTDTRFLGAIVFARNSPFLLENYAFPLDKNNLTYPIQGETIFIIKNENEHFWLPYSVTQYPNYREDYKTTESSKERNINKTGDSSKSKDYNETSQTGTPNTTSPQSQSEKKKYEVKEKIKFLKPKASIYITSNKVKIPFKEEIKKEKVGFKSYPSELNGDQIFVNSDRILLSAKAKEFIIFGKGNTGVITDGRYSVDAKDEIYVHTEKNVIIHSKGSNKIFINSDSGGKIYLGKDSGEGDAGAAVQKMVLGGELVQILGEILDAINQQVYLSPCGPTSPGPTNASQFSSIKSKLKTLLSAKNFLSKS